jgi:hypothetical protein
MFEGRMTYMTYLQWSVGSADVRLQSSNLLSQPIRRICKAASQIILDADE